MLSVNNYQGEIKVKEIKDIGEIIQRIANILKRKNARNISLNGSNIIFNGPTIFFIYLGNPLYHFSRGEIQIKKGHERILISFNVYFKGYFIYFNVCALFFASLAIFLFPTEPILSNVVKMGYIFLFCIMLFGVTHISPMIMFRLMMKEINE